MANISPRKWTNADGKETTSYVATYTDQHGNRKRKQFSKRKDADAWLVNARAQVAAGVHTPDSQSITVNEAADIWLNACSKGRGENPPVEPHTYRSYESHVRNHINPLIGNERISRLTAPRINALRDALLEKLKRPTAKKVLGSLSAILSECQTRGFIAQNVAKSITIKTGGRHKKRVLIPSKEEMKAILQTSLEWSKHSEVHTARAWRRYHALLLTAALTGMRASELRGLRKDHIQLNNLRIIKVRQRADENGIIGRVKTGSSNRDIIIPEALVTVLKGWLIECPVGDLAFPNWVGNVESHANITNRCWKPILERAEIKTHYTPHALRHFHASMLIASGATPKEVMVEMGHSSIQTTFDIYGHLFPEDDEHRRHRAEVMASSLI